MESEENIYSKEFIERLNNHNSSVQSAKVAGLSFKILISLVILLAIGVVVGLNFMTEKRKQQRIFLINNLSALSIQSHEVTRKYQNKINDTKIRVVNEHFFQSLFGLNNTLEVYTKKVYDKDELKILKADLKKTKASLKVIFDRLHKADLNEVLARSYTQELISLLSQNITALQKVIDSGYYDQEFIKQLKVHSTELLKVQSEINLLEEERTKK